jgi:hypothetical protein
MVTALLHHHPAQLPAVSRADGGQALRAVSSVTYKIQAGRGRSWQKETMTHLVTSLATIALLTGVVTDHSYLTWAGVFVWAVIAVKAAIG